METYPAKLPAFLLTGFGYEDIDPLNRTDIQGAAESVSIRTHQGGTTFQVASRMTYCQLRLWEGFWEYKISQGHDWFALGLDVGQGIVEHTARAVDATYAAKRDGWFHWTVSMKLEVEQKAVYSYEEALYMAYGESLAGMIHELVHVTLPGIWG